MKRGRANAGTADLAQVLFAAALACLALASLADAAAAKSRVCRQIEAELAAAGSGGSPARLRQYESAIARQREQMAITRDQAHDAGCGYALSGRSVRQCAAINATLDRMMHNLGKLERDRERLSQGGSKRSRRTLLAALDANDCRVEAMSDQEPATPLTDMLRRAAPDDPDGETAPVEMPSEDRQLYRTMCVRTCDGYFYPMSNAAALSDFDRDQKNCESSCPGTEMQIYYDAFHSGEPAAMVSTRSGMVYSSLPTAFLHQNSAVARNPQCGCGVAKNFEVIAGTPPDAPAYRSDDEPPVPAPRPDAQSETAAVPQDGSSASANEPPASGAGGSIISVAPPERPQASKPRPAAEPGPAEALAPAEPTAPKELDPNRHVRVVGPQFLPDSGAAIDLRGPDQTPDP